MTYVIFDPATGEIVGVDQGARSLEEALRAFSARPRRGGPEARCAQPDAIAAPDGGFEAGKLYRVDVRRRTLAEVEGPEGVGLAYGGGFQAAQPSP